VNETVIVCDINLKCSGVATGGSGGSMNRGPRAPGGPRARPRKLNKQIIGILLKKN